VYNNLTAIDLLKGTWDDSPKSNGGTKMDYHDAAIERARIIRQQRELSERKRRIEEEVIKDAIDLGNFGILQVNWARITPPRPILDDILSKVK
jgi:hypothetical protein